MPDPRDEFTLLCERCGYVIDGLPTERPCPECGTAIAESLPERRPGSPWQRRAGFVTWFRTCAALLKGPVAFWDTVRIEPVRAGFGRANVWAAAGLIGAIVAARVSRGRYGALNLSESGAWGFGAGTFVLIFLFAIAALAWLTQIEAWGVQFFGRRRGWRVTPAVADAICGHASMGWLIGAVLWTTGALAVDTGLVQRTLAEVGLADPYTSAWIRALLPAAGLFTGLLVFEFLVYFGVHRNRFANRARPDR